MMLVNALKYALSRNCRLVETTMESSLAMLLERRLSGRQLMPSSAAAVGALLRSREAPPPWLPSSRRGFSPSGARNEKHRSSRRGSELPPAGTRILGEAEAGFLLSAARAFEELASKGRLVASWQQVEPK